MKIALLSDIHANLLALEAVLNDINTRKPDVIYCLGDLIGYHIWPNEVVALIRKHRIATIAGNHDLKLQTRSKEKSDATFAYDIVGEEEQKYLLSLPAHLRLEFKLQNEQINILLVHGSPKSVYEYVLAEMEEKELLQIMNDANADVLCCGHSHKPFYKVLKSNTVKHIINTGSVGKPKDGNAKACYVLLTIDENFSTTTNQGVEVEFVRVNYDVETSAQAIENSVLPNELATRLREAF